MNRFVKSSLVALCAFAPVSLVVAQDAGPPTPEQQAEQAVLTRQGLLKVMGFLHGAPGRHAEEQSPV